MLEAAQRFAALRADRIIFTKLDEAVSFGVLLNVAKQVNKRLSYLTTGQEVPHQIEPGRPQRLAELVLGGEV
jgi:flagellar biosynthesis protein FlhF